MRDIDCGLCHEYSLANTPNLVFIQEPTHHDANPDLIHEDMCVMSDFELHNLCHEYSVLSSYRLNKEAIVASGKFRKLDELLPKMKEEVCSMYT